MEKIGESTMSLRLKHFIVAFTLWLVVCVTLAGQAADRLPANGVQFTDVTKPAGLAFNHAFSSEQKYIVESMSGGAAFFDYNNDGLPDIYLINSPTVDMALKGGKARCALYRNNGDGTFTDVTDKAGVGYPGWGMGVCAGDYDNDGYVDLYVTCFGPNVLYHNNGDGTFANVTEKAGVGDPRWSTGAAFADYDNDGYLDLVVVNYVDVTLEKLPEFGKDKNCEYRGIKVQCGPRGLPGAGDRLYHNNRDGTFTDVTKAAGVSDPRGDYGLGVIWTDYNDDGLVDLYVANDSVPNFLYKNNGNGTFTEVGFAAGVAVNEDGIEQAGMGVTVGDYDHDGRFDIFVTNFSEDYNTLYRNLGKGLFSDASHASRTAISSYPYLAWGTKFFDYDNDGWVDLLVVNGHVYPQVDAAGMNSYRQRKLLYHNERDGTFTEVAEQAGRALMEKRASRGAAFGDFDNDGDVDTIINDIEGPPMLLRNDGGNRNHSILIRPIGTKSNRDGIGARVKVVAGTLVQIDEVRSGGSYLSHHDLQLHFGLGNLEKVDMIEIRWPSGLVEKIADIKADQAVVVKEGKGSIAAQPFRTHPSNEKSESISNGHERTFMDRHER
jgi:hypothetical protein